MNTYNLGVAFENIRCTKIFTGSIAFHNGLHDVLWNIAVVCKQLFCVFGQTIAAVTKTWVVVMITDAWIQAYPLDNLATF